MLTNKNQQKLFLQVKVYITLICKLLQNIQHQTRPFLHINFVQLKDFIPHMYDIDKAKQLEKQSHVRGALSKQFYSNEQSQLDKKRKEMKRILDEQVEQRKRLKEKEKQQQEKRQKKQEEEIRKYYEESMGRDRRFSDHVSNFNSPKSNHKDPHSNQQNESLLKKQYNQSLKQQRVNSKTTLQQIDGGNIPLLPLMALSDGQINPSRLNKEMENQNSQQSNRFYNNFDRENAGNIPLLDLSDEGQLMKIKKKSKPQIKRQKSERQNNHVNPALSTTNLKNDEIKGLQNQSFSTNNVPIMQHNTSFQSMKKKQRRRTFSDEQNMSIIQQNIINSRVSKGSKFQDNLLHRSPIQTKRNTEMDIPQEIEQMQNQNKFLKGELKKNQEAISLLIGAMRSNPKLDKFRVQAEKILHNSENNSKGGMNQEIKVVQKKQQIPLLLPKLKIKHQSIMHDYLLEAAKKARLKHLKSQASKY